MDFLKKAQESFGQQTGGNSSSAAEGSAAPQGGAAPAQNAGSEDYGDKGMYSFSTLLFIKSIASTKTAALASFIFFVQKS